jgi:hypothetical protein
MSKRAIVEVLACIKQALDRALERIGIQITQQREF